MCSYNIGQRYVNRFWGKVHKSDSCWLWGGYLDKLGYGTFYDGEKMRKAHRFAYKISKGDIPVEREVDHLCRNRACVNPDHLEAVTHEENCRRGIGSKTHCRQGHKFTKWNTLYHSTNGQRRCRNCIIIRGRLARLKSKTRLAVV